MPSSLVYKPLVIWGNISRSFNGENVLGGVAYKNKCDYSLSQKKIFFFLGGNPVECGTVCLWEMLVNIHSPEFNCAPGLWSGVPRPGGGGWSGVPPLTFVIVIVIIIIVIHTIQGSAWPL